MTNEKKPKGWWGETARTLSRDLSVFEERMDAMEKALAAMPALKELAESDFVEDTRQNMVRLRRMEQTWEALVHEINGLRSRQNEIVSQLRNIERSITRGA